MTCGTRLQFLALLLWITGGLAGRAEAHLRDYLLNQSYYTARRGEVELEFHNDMNFPEADQDDSYSSKHQVELEVGVTDHVQLAVYEVYTWDRANDWERDAMKLEAKARFAEAGDWPVDVALYTEWQNPDGHRARNSDELENKIILSRNFGPLNVAGNIIFERKLNERSDWAFAYTLGASYAVAPLTRLGLELKDTMGDSDEFGWHRKDHQLTLLPGVYTSLTPHVRVLFGPAFGLTRAADDLQLRSLVEVEF